VPRPFGDARDRLVCRQIGRFMCPEQSPGSAVETFELRRHVQMRFQIPCLFAQLVQAVLLADHRLAVQPGFQVFLGQDRGGHLAAATEVLQIASRVADQEQFAEWRVPAAAVQWRTHSGDDFDQQATQP
jgi:hypothetical protein